MRCVHDTLAKNKAINHIHRSIIYLYKMVTYVFQISKLIKIIPVKAFSSSLMSVIIVRNHLPFFNIFSNFVHFCPNFQIFCAFLPFFEKSHACPYCHCWYLLTLWRIKSAWIKALFNLLSIDYRDTVINSTQNADIYRYSQSKQVQGKLASYGNK